MSSSDTISRLAEFYRAQAVSVGVPVLNDSGSKFADYRTLAFAKQPRFLDVVLTRQNGRTKARVSYHLTVSVGCN